MVVGRSEASGIERTLPSPVPCQMLGLLDPPILFKRILNFKLYLVIWVFLGGRGVWAMAQMWGGSQDNLHGPVLHFHNMGSRNRTHVIRLGSKHL